VYSSANYVPELDFFGDAFDSQSNLPQYNYPPPIAAHNHRPLPYLKPSVRTPDQIVACHPPSVGCTEAAWAPRYSHANSLTVGPNQVGLVNVGHRDRPRARARGDSEAVVDQSTLSTTSYTLQSVTSHHNSAQLQPQTEFQTSTLANDPFRDASTPYVPGVIVRRGGHLQDLTDVLTAVVEQSTFACSYCKKDCKTKSALRYVRPSHLHPII
jgi:hypothetical protein